MVRFSLLWSFGLGFLFDKEVSEESVSYFLSVTHLIKKWGRSTRRCFACLAITHLPVVSWLMTHVTSHTNTINPSISWHLVHLDIGEKAPHSYIHSNEINEFIFPLPQILDNFQFVDKSTSLGVQTSPSSLPITLATPEVKGIEILATTKLRVLCPYTDSSPPWTTRRDIILRERPEFLEGLIIHCS